MRKTFVDLLKLCIFVVNHVELGFTSFLALAISFYAVTVSLHACADSDSFCWLHAVICFRLTVKGGS